MKKIYIVAVVMIAVAIALLTNASKDMSTYANFEVARESGRAVKVNGLLSKDKEMYYNPSENPNYFTFYVKDTKGEERKVVLKAAKPQDFEKSEQIVVTGKMAGDEFIASDVLLKCPSKYKDEEVYIKSGKGT
ncbi:MAG: cytochrome c maturation protein CcmE [Lewinellaceae bacterium]|nr:cytochrome c maturation protein CcmE [Saprospiraceae bacterium]MCB9341004.1 cytochrome c maturation protein CcmE [Lewinellaceae bacterium]